MNKNEFQTLNSTVPSFEKYLKEVRIEDIVFDKYNSQIRKDGHVTKKVPTMAEGIRNGRTGPPPSVRDLPNGKSELKDGATRVLANQAAGNDTIVVSTYHDQTQGFDEDQWYDWQCVQNDHPPSTPNSLPDIQSQIQHRIDKGICERKVGFKYAQDPERWLSEVVTYLCGVYANSGLSKTKLKNMLKTALGGEISVSFEAYTKDTSMNRVALMNDKGWSSSKKGKASIGEICNNVCFYPCGNYAQLKTNAFAGAAYKKIDNPTVKMYIVYYIADLSGLSANQIIHQRKKAHAEYKKINGTYNCFDGFLVLPQIKTGDLEEDLNKFVEV